MSCSICPGYYVMCDQSAVRFVCIYLRVRGTLICAQTVLNVLQQARGNLSISSKENRKIQTFMTLGSFVPTMTTKKLAADLRELHVLQRLEAEAQAAYFSVNN